MFPSGKVLTPATQGTVKCTTVTETTSGMSNHLNSLDMKLTGGDEIKPSDRAAIVPWAKKSSVSYMQYFKQSFAIDVDKCEKKDLIQFFLRLQSLMRFYVLFKISKIIILTTQSSFVFPQLSKSDVTNYVLLTRQRVRPGDIAGSFPNRNYILAQ